MMFAPSQLSEGQRREGTTGLSKADLLQALRALAEGNCSLRIAATDYPEAIDTELVEALNNLVQSKQTAELHEHRIAYARANEGTEPQPDGLKNNFSKFIRVIRERRNPDTVVSLIFQELASFISFHHALIYLRHGGPNSRELKLSVVLPARQPNTDYPEKLLFGGGLAGRCAELKTKIIVPAKPTSPASGHPESPEISIPQLSTIAMPVQFDGQVLAVLEIAFLGELKQPDQLLLQDLSECLSTVLHSIEAENHTETLLKESQALARELQLQQDRLRQANQDLEGKARVLASRKSEVERKNREIEQARQALREKAEQVAQTSEYKSAFLANMSHELRTPLNSMLLLARQLAENHDRTMTDKQVEFAKVIHAAGNELLRLINDILDLSKIESGTVTVNVAELQLRELQAFIERNFRMLAKSKSLEFSVLLSPALPPSALTDGRRLEQILKNLLANAFKFTDKGSVHVSIRPATSGWNPDNASLNRAESVVAFAVSDTGIGISESKQKIIFEAFQQGDSGTDRKFGGTGLGLTISREIARLLGGEIQLSSTPGAGSVFTLYLPLRFPSAGSTDEQEKDVPVEVFIHEERARLDDRDKIQPGDLVLLSIEDDSDFTDCLRDIARKSGFRSVCAVRGEDAFELIRRHPPNAITLNLRLPDKDGWKILEHLKNNPLTRHIPVSIISCEADRNRNAALGVVSQMLKPVPVPILKNAVVQLKGINQRRQKRLLVVKHDGANLINALGPDVTTTAAKGGQAALSLCKTHTYDCVVSDMELPDMTAFHFLAELRRTHARDLPIIIDARKPLTIRERVHLRKLENKMRITTVRSDERLIDKAALFLHIPVEKLPATSKQLIDKLYLSEAPLTGKRVLIVDDDIRNIFALTSLIERHGMHALSAEKGQAALSLLESGEQVDVVLMDIMMPGLDGYKTIEALRRNPRFDELPIIAVTAKAMIEDRLRCLESGASGYVSKPVDSRQLLATLREWLHR